MIRPTDNLRTDHAVITTGLRVLASLGDHVRRGGSFPVADCALAIRFVREFVIGVHLHKEASVLLPRLAMHGDEETARGVGEALRLQEEVGELVHSLVLFWEPTADLTAAERQGFAETVDAVVGRCRRLAALEEGGLFAAFDREVPADDQLDCERECAAVEAERSTATTWSKRLAPVVARWAS